jgi:hypothetical protein
VNLCLQIKHIHLNYATEFDGENSINGMQLQNDTKNRINV